MHGCTLLVTHKLLWLLAILGGAWAQHNSFNVHKSDQFNRIQSVQLTLLSHTPGTHDENRFGTMGALP